MSELTLSQKEKELFDNFDKSFAEFAEGNPVLETLAKIKISEIKFVDDEV